MKINQQPEIITVTLNPAIDSTLYFNGFQIGQVNRVGRQIADPGGKGVNVAKVLKALGLEVSVTGFLGRENAAFFHRYFAEEQINDYFIESDGATRTNIKIVNETDGKVTEINYAGLQCSARDLGELEAKLLNLAAPGNWVVLSGSLSQNAPVDSYARYIEKLQARGCKVLLDTSGPALQTGLRAKPYLVKPNINELRELTGSPLQAETEIWDAMDAILNAGVQQVVVSLGAKGALAASREQKLRVQPPRIEAKSTVGAGDAMVAGLIAGQAQGLSLEESIRLATAAAAASVAKAGTRAGSLDEVEKLQDQVIIEEIGAKP